LRRAVICALVSTVPLVITVPGQLRARAQSGVPECALLASCHFSVLRDQHAKVIDGPHDDHQVDIQYDLYIPDIARSQPQPGIIHFNGLGGGKNDHAAVLTATLMAIHGYVVLAYTSQGNGDPSNGTSGGVLELDSPDYDGKDARQMLDILAARPEVSKVGGDPQVGTTGGSYGGAIQETLAEFDSRVKVISPWRTFYSAEYTLAPNNLGLGYQFQSLPAGPIKHVSAPPVALGWLDAVFVRGLLIGAEHGNVSTCPGWDARICPLVARAVAAGRADPESLAVLQHSSPETWIDPGSYNPLYPGHPRPGLRVPTMLVEGEHDFLFNENEAIADFTALQARGVPVEMIWQYGGHGYDTAPTGGGTGEGDLQGDLDAQRVPEPISAQVAAVYGQKYLPRRLVAWMDHWLRHTGADTGPRFSYYRDWVAYDHAGDAGPAFGDAQSYPAERSQTFGLSADGRLLSPGTSSLPGSVNLLNPAGGVPASFTEQPNFQSPGSTVPGANTPSPWLDVAPSDPPGEVATFTFGPLGHEVTSVGGPTLHLHVRSQSGAADVTLYAKLFDVAPDGSVAMVPRAPAPVRIPLSGGAATADVKLLPVAHLFRAGHLVRLAICTTDAAMTGNRAPDVITLATGGTDDPATFSLPVDEAAIQPEAAPVIGNARTPNPGLPNTAPTGTDPRGTPALLVTGSLIALGISTRRRRVVR